METTQPTRQTPNVTATPLRPTARRHHRSQMMTTGVIAILICVGLQACNLNSIFTGPPVATNGPITPSVTPLPNPPQHNFATVQYCIDSTGSYPDQEFQDANTYMANSINAGIEANEAGFNVYVTYINGDPLNPNSTPLVFNVPAINPYPTMPPAQPTFTPSNNGFSNAAAQQAEEATQTVTAWNQNYPAVDATVTAQINAAQQSVASKLNTLRHLARLSSDTSVWGCLYEGSQRFTNAQSGDKWLVIASDLQDNIPVDITKVNFHGVKIRVIDFYCAGTTNDCQNTQSQWTSLFEQAGAAKGDIRFYDRAQTDVQPLLFSGNA